MPKEFKVNDKITVSYEILQEIPDFAYCGRMGVIIDGGCTEKNPNEISIDFGSSILCVEKKYVKGLRE